MPPLTCSGLTTCSIAAVIVQMVGVSLFMLGFFPVKPTLSGVSGPESFRPPDHEVYNLTTPLPPPTHLKSLYQELSEIPPSFDRLILMVIDGLPAEFVLGKDGQPPSKALTDAMPYTQSLLKNGMAIGYHAKAAPPTVTMPRLKAMVSGAIGGFLDVAFNFNTQALLDDNLLGQFFSIGWKMVMLGDETWLKLFPGLFTRHDGVSSFYVKDTVQVDQNVSRHLGYELNRDDWDLLILHYLGLDHVGHIGGRNSVLMTPKLMEMDEVVKMIHLNTIVPQDDIKRQTLLVVVSDHGMTDNGNHGGSSYEETDSLVLFIGPTKYASDYASATHNTAYQVDIAPTLALLFGVPIPKNNVGVLIAGIFTSLTDDQQLRALELNSWQLLRLLEAQLPGLSCRSFNSDGFSDDQGLGISKCSGSMDEMFCCLYRNAKLLHSSWKLKTVSSSPVAAYHDFLKAASEWLSHRATDKPVNLLAYGVAAMILSCVILFTLIFCLCKEVDLREKQLFSDKNRTQGWHLHETFTLGVTLFLVISMGSSSMVEEEQYIWHFMTSTLYLLLFRNIIQSFPAGTLQSSAGSDYIKLIHLGAGLLLISLSLFGISLLKSKRNFILVVQLAFSIPGLLVLQHIMKYQDSTSTASSYGATLLAQTIYVILGIMTTGTVIASPWFMPVWISETCSSCNFYFSTSVSIDGQNKSLLIGLRDSVYLIGWAYLYFWCLLQMLLQQPINSMPILLLLMQILASMLYSSNGRTHKQWVEVAAIYYLGMAGHFSLGNSNTLATIDVAGAYIGLSSHSTLLSGILMFIITYASPMLALLSMVMYISLKDPSYFVIPQNADYGYLLKMMIGCPCLVPLCLNSVLLTAYTVVLLLMRNHLFVWSVFSPKYLYVCATTVCVYVGVFVVAVTGFYTCLVFAMRRKRQDPFSNEMGKSLIGE
ncbi:hypothetical protein VitviT2T_010746 [Vitis vinifera]|uniref:GPI ethanolamine phosphate transferase 2 C-terminal domain-containing protein n=1 Tax=Vitis vinifera TaxID=29760 RepID=A0ABY9C8T5_VITVI|nr:hypothetical protein VitviT2T_010746 [Vitis vinifera]